MSILILFLTSGRIEYANRILSGKDWEVSISAYFLCTEPCGTATASAHTYPLITASLFAIILWISWRGCHWFSEIGVLGACLSSGSFKSWGIRCGTQTFRCSERSWEGVVPSQLCGIRLGMGFMTRMCPNLSYWFQWGYFLIQLMCRSPSASFRISFKENYSLCGCPLSVPVVGEFKSLLCCHL